MSIKIFVILLIAATGVCDTVNHIGAKWCANSIDVHVDGLSSAIRYSIRFLKMPLAWMSITFALLSLFIWLFALTMAELSFAFSLDSVHHVFIALASKRILKENVGWQRLLGTTVIMSGIVLVALSGTA